MNLLQEFQYWRYMILNLPADSFSSISEYTILHQAVTHLAFLFLLLHLCVR
jgi:hypothetical protein